MPPKIFEVVPIRITREWKWNWNSISRVCVCGRVESPVDYKLYPWMKRSQRDIRFGLIRTIFRPISVRDSYSTRFPIRARYSNDSWNCREWFFFFFLWKRKGISRTRCADALWQSPADRSSIASMIFENLENSIALIRSPWNEISWVKEGLPSGLKGRLLGRISILRRDSSLLIGGSNSLTEKNRVSLMFQCVNYLNFTWVYIWKIYKF